MPMTDIHSWLGENQVPGKVWMVKRLSANDTGQTGGHQAGPYLPRKFMLELFSNLKSSSENNPDCVCMAHIDSNFFSGEVRVIWYRQKTRNEVRITGWGGQECSLLDVENTGALAIFSFHIGQHGYPDCINIWICRDNVEEDFVEGIIGVVETGRFRVWSANPVHANFFSRILVPPSDPCWLQSHEIQNLGWSDFPSAIDTVKLSVEKQVKFNQMSSDVRLVKRRDCEYRIFESIEEEIYFPIMKKGFNTREEFNEFSKSMNNKRKSRSGKSFELHTREILQEEEIRNFVYQPKKLSDGDSPDFLFPSVEAYNDPRYPAGKLRMLTAKTTFKDRWRQVLQEGRRIEEKHLLTLQKGASENQCRAIKSAGVVLVVPEEYQKEYPESCRDDLLSLEQFIADVRLLEES